MVSPEKNATMLRDFEEKEPIALVFGKELEGVSDEILDYRDKLCGIWMFSFTKSF